jgi:hypothetical protein
LPALRLWPTVALPPLDTLLLDMCLFVWLFVRACDYQTFAVVFIGDARAVHTRASTQKLCGARRALREMLNMMM